MSQYSLSVLCHFVTLADCIRSGYVGGQLVITRHILSIFFFFTMIYLCVDMCCFHGSVIILTAVRVFLCVCMWSCVCVCAATVCPCASVCVTMCMCALHTSVALLPVAVLSPVLAAA